MFNYIIKDKKRRNRFKKFEIKTLQNKSIFQDHLLLRSFIKLLSTKKDETLSTKKEKTTLQNDKIHQLYSFWINRSLQSSIGKTNPRNCSQTRIKNRCIESGRSASVLRFCKLSRIVLRDKASKGLISGVSKASW